VGRAGRMVGWGHHHWLCEVRDGAVEFVFKHHILHAREDLRVPHRVLTPSERVSTLWLEGSFAFRERVFVDGEELEAWLRDVVPAQPRRGWLGGARSR